MNVDVPELLHLNIGQPPPGNGDGGDYLFGQGGEDGLLLLVSGDTLVELVESGLHFLEGFVLLKGEVGDEEIEVGDFLGQLIFGAAIEVAHLGAKGG